PRDAKRRHGAKGVSSHEIAPSVIGVIDTGMKETPILLIDLHGRSATAGLAPRPIQVNRLGLINLFDLLQGRVELNNRVGKSEVDAMRVSAVEKPEPIFFAAIIGPDVQSVAADHRVVAMAGFPLIGQPHKNLVRSRPDLAPNKIGA